MKESILRAAAIASFAMSFIMAVSTWFGVASGGIRGGGLLGFFYGLLLIFLGAVAWALFNSLADVSVVRGRVDAMTQHLVRLQRQVDGVTGAGTGDATAGPAPAHAHTAPLSEQGPAEVRPRLGVRRAAKRSRTTHHARADRGRTAAGTGGSTA